jgi:hypothetical protein
VVNFLDDLHVLIELIQLSGAEENEVMAHYETNARDFVYASSEPRKLDYQSGQREVRMPQNENFPGSIAPQLRFSTAIRIDETHTPSLDILREYEGRFVPDPVIQLNKKAIQVRHERGLGFGFGSLTNQLIFFSFCALPGICTQKYSKI